MGKKNRIMCGYLEKPVRFADFINGSLYGGKQVVAPDEIKDSPTVYAKEERARDILKMVYKEENYVLIGVENQDSVHYAMPVRCMEYDTLEYKRQLRELREKNERQRKENGSAVSGAEFLSGMLKKDRLTPVVTVVFYHGEEEYDGCRNLHDMLHFGKENEIFEQYIPNYHINLVTLKELKEENFKTDVRELIGFMKRRGSRKALEEYCRDNEERIRQMNEDTFNAVSVMINQPGFIAKRAEYEEGGKVNMCKAMEDWKEELLKEGMERGIAQGIECGVERGIEAMILENIEEGVSEERILEKLQKHFGLDVDLAKERYSRYEVCH